MKIFPRGNYYSQITFLLHLMCCNCEMHLSSDSSVFKRFSSKENPFVEQEEEEEEEVMAFGGVSLHFAMTSIILDKMEIYDLLSTISTCINRILE